MNTTTPNLPISLRRRPRRALAAIGTAAVVLAACGGSDDADEPAATPAEETTEAPAEAPAPVQTASSDLGDHLVTSNGLTLYGFTPDADGVPTCEGDCADAWPPLLADEVPAGLDPAIFSVVDGPNGSQLKAGDWPLYRFAADIAAGDVSGQGSGGVWFVVAPDGSLIGAEGAMDAMEDEAMDEEAMEDEAMEEAATAVQTASSEFGDLLVNADGFTLYGFTPDAEGVPTCEGTCAEAWPPILADEVPAGLDPAIFSVVDGPNGSQLKAGDWPLYLFAADVAPGDVTGQGSGDVWFVVAPDGTLIGADAAAGLQAPADDAETTDDTTSGGYDY